MMLKPFFFVLAGVCCLTAGCDRDDAAPAAPGHDETAPAQTNRVDIPPNVRQNLGITFARVERRAVTRTLRLPGAFELLPTASREYRAAAAGKIELLVRQYDAVEAGQVLGRIESPRLRELQQQLADVAASVTLAQAAVDSMPPFFDAHDKHHVEIEKAVELWARRVSQLEQARSAGGGQAGELAAASASLASARADFAETLEKEAELNARKIENEAQLAAAHQKFDLLLATMTSLTGHSVDALAARSNAGPPLWQTLSFIESRAASPGIISAIGTTNGSYVESSAHLLTVIAPDQVRFRARGFQSDLGRLKTGLPAKIVPPAGSDIVDTTPMTGALVLAPQAAPESRTIDLIVTPERVADWAIDGVAGFVEITLAGTGTEELAVPMACVVSDGATPVLFRRDPRDPDKVIRIEADVGANDGRWVVIHSGVAEGNEIVQHGAYQLLVATSGTIQKGGHFHPDGTFHEGED
jgi:multidrug efflux pump subunit AcrA (membrane-fusion protein)